MRVLLCCDATARGGLGHFFRSVAIAEEALERGWEVWIAGSIEVPLAVDAARALRVEVILTDLGDGAAILRCARTVRADVLHVDSYAAPRDLAEARSASDVLLSSMEDGEFGRRAADVVIDPSPGAELDHRPSDGSGVHLRGLAFAPLRRSIRDATGWSGPNRPPQVTVMIGGTDPFAVSERIGSALAAGLPGTGVQVVGPPSTPVSAGFAVRTPTEEVTALVEGSDLAIVGAGTTVWELCRLGVPMAVVRVVANQQATFAFTTERGLTLPFAVVDDDGAMSAPAIDAVRDLLEDEAALALMSARGRSLVDGSGTVRIVDAWTGAVPRPTGLALRTVHEGDASLLFDWRNDAQVRAVSRSTGALRWQDHREWFARASTDPDTALFIATVDGRPAGQVRFDRTADGWTVSVVVDAAFRHRGLGAEIVRRGEALLRAEHGPVRVAASVATTNLASIRLFDSIGYRRTAGQDDPGWTGFESVP